MVEFVVVVEGLAVVALEVVELAAVAEFVDVVGYVEAFDIFVAVPIASVALAENGE